MNKYNRVFNVIAVFIFIGFFWITALFLTFSFPDNKESLKELLPKDVEVVLSVNADQLLKTLLFDALYKSEFDASDLKLFERVEKSKDAKSFGVLLNSEIVVFYQFWNKTPIQGFLFNISSKETFDDFRLKGKNYIKRSNGKQGIIINLKDNASDELIQYSTQFAEEVIAHKTKSKVLASKSEMLSLKYKGNDHAYIQDLNLSAKIADEKIVINGSGKKNKTLYFSVEEYNVLAQTPKEKHLEIQSGKLPDSIYQYFKVIFDEIGIKTPEVTSQQMMIYGVSIENINGSTVVLPKFDWILRFDSIVNIKEQLYALDESTDKMKYIDKKSIKVGGAQYYYRQISDHEIYIGVTESPDIQSVKTQILPLIRGNPSVLLEIEGKGIIAQFINVMPQVKNTKVFMQNVEYFDIHTIDGKKDDLKIDGEIRLIKGKMMTVELVKFILMFVK